MKSKCSICNRHWADCIHLSYDDVYATPRQQTALKVGGFLLAVAAITFVVVMIGAVV